MKKTQLQNWKKLYTLAKEVYKQSPWDYLWDVNLIGVQLENSEPYFCSIMGQGGRCTGVAIYYELSGLSDFRQLSDAKSIYSAHYLMGDQDCITMYVGNKSEVPQTQLKIMKELNIEFNEGEYIYFNSFKKRYYPTDPDEEELENLVEIFDALVYAFDQDREWFNIKWEEYNMLLVEHSDDPEEPWFMMELPEPRWMVRNPSIEFEDQDLMKELLEQPYNDVELALDLNYLFVPITDENYERDINALMCLAMDLKTDQLLGVDLIDPYWDDLQVCLDIFINCVSNYGRPHRIYLRNPKLIDSCSGLFEELGIEVVEDALEEMDDVMNHFLQVMNEDFPM